MGRNMCVGGSHLQISGVLLLLVSAAVTRASSYMRAHSAKEMWPYFRLKCDLKCPYGYQTDVEGNSVCLCHDPCQNVRCFGNTECVVDESKPCIGDNCRPHATCRVVNQPAGLHQSPPSQPRFQADDATTTSAETSAPATCLLPVAEEAKQCRKQRMRWFYDSVSGTCRQFRGCRGKGNNFKRQRGCERMCVTNRKNSSKGRSKSRLTQSAASSLTSQETQRAQAPPVCLLPAVPVTTGCKRLRRRWFFDASLGSCRKFLSCRTPGNNFSKKRHCRRKCLGKKKSSRRKGRRSAQKSAVQ